MRVESVYWWIMFGIWKIYLDYWEFRYLSFRSKNYLVNVVGKVIVCILSRIDLFK